MLKLSATVKKKLQIINIDGEINYTLLISISTMLRLVIIDINIPLNFTLVFSL